MKTNRLSAQVLPIQEIDPDFSVKLYRLFTLCYENVTWARFEGDLAEKDFVIVLNDIESGEPKGFSTQQLLRANLDGKPIRALFSGDTIIEPGYWGEQELVRGWCSLAGQVLAEESSTPLYWLLISKGFRTYLYLPVFYHEFWPRYDRPTPEWAQKILNALATLKWPKYYNEASGLLEFSESLGNIKTEIAHISDARMDDPHVQFFLKANPSYMAGSELVCLAPISLENTKSIGRRLIQQAIRNSCFARPAHLQSPSCLS